MKAETEEYLEKVQQTRNHANNRGKLVKKAIRFLKPKEKRQREEEKTWINQILNQPPWALKDLTERQRGELARRRNCLEDELKEYSPPTDISGETKDALYKFQKQLEEEIKVGMPTHETMRRNPPGAVDMHQAWEKRSKDKVIIWKNVKRLLDPDNEGKDYTNVEMLRPSGLSPETLASNFMANAQIPGVFGMTPLAKTNWPEGMSPHGTTDNAYKQLERREIAEEMVDRGLVPVSEIDQLKEQIRLLQEQWEGDKLKKAAIKAKRQEVMAKARAARKKKGIETETQVSQVT